MTSSYRIGLLALALVACGTPADKASSGETDSPVDTDTEDTDVADTDVADTDVPDDDVVAINLPPSAPQVSLAPTNPDTDDDLVVVFDQASFDPEGDPITYTYAWTRNGTVVPGLTTDTVPAASTFLGDVWRVTVTPFDGTSSGDGAVAAITVINPGLVVEDAAIVPARPTSTDDLHVRVTDPAGVLVDVDVTWFIDGVAVAGAPAGTTLPASFTTRGQAVHALVMPIDATSPGASSATEAVTIGNASPVVPTPVIDPGVVHQNGTAACSLPTASFDPDGDAVLYDVTFWIDRPNDPFLPPSSTTYTTIEARHTEGIQLGAATGWVLSSPSFEFGDQISCHVAALDGTTTTEVHRDAAVVQADSVPPVPRLDRAPTGVNAADLALTGQCDFGALSCAEIHVACEGDVGTTKVVPDTTTACLGPDFDVTVALPSDEIATCWSWCESPGAGGIPNRSPNSPAYTTEVCPDAHASGPVALTDAGRSVQLTGTLPGGSGTAVTADPSDVFTVVQAPVLTDLGNGTFTDATELQVDLTDGPGDFRVLVQEQGAWTWPACMLDDTTVASCTVAPTGTCGAGLAPCPTERTWQITVVRTDGGDDCAPYTLDVTW